MKQIKTWIASVLLVVNATLAWAQESRPVVVELFTSQGCSSCPPADAFLRELAGRDDVIALALLVDYWDYIGWKDVFARTENTARQKAYATVAGRRSIYTPQMVVGGLHDVVGTHPRDVEDLIRKDRNRASPIKLSAARKGNQLRLEASTSAPFSPPLDVQLVRLRPNASVTVNRGENAGKILDYHNIVTDWQVIARWDGRAPLQITQDISGTEPVVVILQHPGPGAIEAALRLR
jgi:hypothetical protein